MYPLHSVHAQHHRAHVPTQQRNVAVVTAPAAGVVLTPPHRCASASVLHATTLVYTIRVHYVCMHTLTVAVQHYVVLLLTQQQRVHALVLLHNTVLVWCTQAQHPAGVHSRAVRVLVYTAASTAALRCTVANTTTTCASTAAKVTTTAAHCCAMHTAMLSPYTTRVRCHRMHTQQQQLQCVVLHNNSSMCLCIYLLSFCCYTLRRRVGSKV